MTTHPQRDWDVVVVGARVAGAATAMLLARGGARVLLLEKSREGSDTLSTHALMRAGVLQLTRWGLREQVAAGAAEVRRTLFHYGADDPVSVSIRPSPGVPHLFAPRRTVLDRVLATSARDSGAEVRHGTTVVALTRDPGGSVTGVVARDRDGRLSRERAPLVVGADGIRSAVADLVGAPTLWRGRAAASVIYGYWEDLPAEGYEWYYGDGAAAGLIPTHDGLTCAFVGTDAPVMSTVLARATPSSALGLLGGRLPGLTERLASARPDGRMRLARGVPGYLRQAHGPGWALVGDAGYWKDALSTHGMTDAMRDAELLSRAILASPGTTAGRARALADYQATRDRLSSPMIEVVEQMASFAWDQTRIRQLLRALSASMVDEVELLEALDFPDPASPRGVPGRATQAVTA